MTTKRLPTEKTVVSELNIQLVDQFTRNRLIKDSIAAKVGTGVTMGDASIVAPTPLILPNITTMVYINSWAPIKLKITHANSSIVDVPCQGTFLFYGVLQSIEILPQVLEETIRLSYVYA